MVSTTHLECAKIAIIARVVTRWQLLVLTLTAFIIQKACARTATWLNIIGTAKLQKREGPPKRQEPQIRTSLALTNPMMSKTVA